MPDGGYVMRLVGLANGEPSTLDGWYVESADVLDPAATRDVWRAQRWPTQAAAHEAWRAVHPHEPVRPDGEANRPLTAWTVSIEPAPSDRLAARLPPA